MNNFVTIKSFASSVDFEMVISYLASCGIECFGRDEITNRAYLNGVNGGVKLQVSEDKVEETINLLLEGGYITKEDLETCYHTFYHPSNMFIVITGNFDSEEIMNVIKENQKYS